MVGGSHCVASEGQCMGGGLAQGRWGGEVVDWGVVAGTEGGVVAEVLGADISSRSSWRPKKG